MGDVIGIESKKPHITGNAKCITCSHEWVAVAPVGCIEMECPECHTMKGVWIWAPRPDEFWRCICGNEFFYVDRIGCQCAKCGLRPDLPS